MTMTPVASAILPALPETPPALRACLISLAGSAFGVDVRSAREVAVFDEITPLPRAPRHLIGVANLRGTILPIMDIRGALGLPEGRPPRSVRTLVVRDGSLVVAAVVDSVLGLEPFDAILPPDSPSASRVRAPRQFVAGWITWAGEAVPVLDVRRLLAVLRTTVQAVEPALEDRA
jgi:purine-binding chemotaxis protein CheW